MRGARLLNGVLLVCVSLFCGCESSSEFKETVSRSMEKAWDYLLDKVRFSGQSPDLPSGEALESVDLKQFQAHSELLSEMFQVVLQREPRHEEEFNGYRSALAQGATLEGIYNGFTHSLQYRRLEIANPGSRLETVRVFADELERLESELQSPTLFNAKSAQPLEKMMTPAQLALELSRGNFKSPKDDSPSHKSKKQDNSQLEFLDPQVETGQGSLGQMEDRSRSQKTLPGSNLRGNAAIRYYQRIFYMASIYTLKRVLGDEAMKVVDSKREDREQLARWYGRWSVRMAKHGVDFGLVLRNKEDEEFHYQWALKASEDGLRWEVLNRLHRLINETNRKKI